MDRCGAVRAGRPGIAVPPGASVGHPLRGRSRRRPVARSLRLRLQRGPCRDRADVLVVRAARRQARVPRRAGFAGGRRDAREPGSRAGGDPRRPGVRPDRARQSQRVVGCGTRDSGRARHPHAARRPTASRQRGQSRHRQSRCVGDDVLVASAHGAGTVGVVARRRAGPVGRRGPGRPRNPSGRGRRHGGARPRDRRCGGGRQCAGDPITHRRIRRRRSSSRWPRDVQRWRRLRPEIPQHDRAW